MSFASILCAVLTLHFLSSHHGHCWAPLNLSGKPLTRHTDSTLSLRAAGSSHNLSMFPTRHRIDWVQRCHPLLSKWTSYNLGAASRTTNRMKLAGTNVCNTSFLTWQCWWIKPCFILALHTRFSQAWVADWRCPWALAVRRHAIKAPRAPLRLQAPKRGKDCSYLKSTMAKIIPVLCNDYGMPTFYVPINIKF